MLRLPILLSVAVSYAGSCYGASAAIGISSGDAAVAEGTQLKTAAIPNEISLQNGVRLRLSPGSVGTVFSDHIVLAEGALTVDNFREYRVEAGPLQVRTDDAAANAVVRVDNDKVVEVASVGGSLRITDGGTMLAKVVSGTRVSFRTGRKGSASRNPYPNHHVMLWVIGATAAAALAIGLTAAAQGKSPF